MYAMRIWPRSKTAQIVETTINKHRDLEEYGKVAMTERIIELLYRNLQEVFGEGDAARRRAAIDEFYTDDCVLFVPPGVFVGRDPLD